MNSKTLNPAQLGFHLQQSLPASSTATFLPRTGPFSSPSWLVSVGTEADLVLPSRAEGEPFEGRTS
jgi:hypothetical protein